jgi:hypothetical protein
MGYGWRQVFVGGREKNELAREKMWSRIYLTPLLQAEEDRDQARRHFADLAREKELLGSTTSAYNSDRYVPTIMKTGIKRGLTSMQICAADIWHHTGIYYEGMSSGTQTHLVPEGNRLYRMGGKRRQDSSGETVLKRPLHSAQASHAITLHSTSVRPDQICQCDAEIGTGGVRFCRNSIYLANVMLKQYALH